jgi:tRNA (mo5U34)-methyltransferase
MKYKQEEINKINWFHHYDEETFGFSTQGTKGMKSKDEAKLWGFNTELFSGSSVLDIGAWDGYYSFLAEKMGAERVLATDRHCWGGPGVGTKEGFDMAHRILGSSVESKEIDVPDISPDTVGVFDVVLFLGVLYHLPDPLLGLQNATDVTRKVLVIETTYEQLSGEDDRALFELRPERLKHDRTCYWSPNIRGLRAVLRKIMGFEKIIIKPKNHKRLICFAYK